MKIEGIYGNIEDTVQAVDRLRDQGYTHDDVTVVANKDVRDRLTANIDADVEPSDMATEDQHSLWDSIKDFFTTEDSYEESTNENGIHIPEEHRDEIRSGKIAVFINEDAEPRTTDTTAADTPHGADTADLGVAGADQDLESETRGLDTAPTDQNLDTTPNEADTTQSDRSHGDHDTEKHRDLNESDDEKIELKEERLKVDKEKEKKGEVHVSKKVVEDEESVDIPVEKEEVTIERKPVTDKEVSDDAIELEEGEEIVIPVEEEKAKAEKETDVVEEVEIKKETKEDTETVSDTVRREELDVEEDGDVIDGYDDEVEQPADDDTLDEEISTNRFNEEFDDNNKDE